MPEDGLDFGRRVLERSQVLASQGKDPNQIAKILHDADRDGRNYGIGIILGSDGRPMPTSSTILDRLRRELETSGEGDYQNSTALMDEIKRAVLRWQRVPESAWPSFLVFLPSDAGTGAVKTGAEIILALRPELTSIAVQELGWPAYPAIARSCRVTFREFPVSGVVSKSDVLTIYQAGPMNTTGDVPEAGLVADRARAAAACGVITLLDRAYSGFEFARAVDSDGYDKAMRMSYHLQLAPFVEQGIPFLVAISPTKCFLSFALRPAGLLLAFVPDATIRRSVKALGDLFIRARGSSFEHPATRAFVKALALDLPRLERDHAEGLKRVAVAEREWASLSKGTPIEDLFSEKYAGLFRNPRAREEAPLHLYGLHLYPVFSSGRCRINITGIPGDPELRRQHVQTLAEYCSA
jgi:aspartate/tyrosine/aromatic aminotransferase